MLRFCAWRGMLSSGEQSGAGGVLEQVLGRGATGTAAYEEVGDPSLAAGPL